MSRAHTITTTTIDRWLLPHIAGILAYADSDPAFALTLATWLDEENWSITPTNYTTASRYLTPTSSEQADDVLDWLMHELATHPEARIARSRLVSWASEYVAPENLIWGVALTDTFGPTVTGMPNKKRPQAELQVIVDSNWQEQQSSTDLLEQTHSLTQRLIAIELRKASGKLSSLHPNTAEWCMGGADTKLHPVAAATVRDILSTAEAEGVHHLPLYQQDTLVAVAVSPTVSGTLTV